MSDSKAAILRFDHLGLVVKKIDKANSKISKLLSVSEWTSPIDDPVNGVRLQFGRDPTGMVYELLEPLGDDSPVSGALQSGKAILNHVAYIVADLQAAGDHLAIAGSARVSEPKPAIAYGGRPIQFFVTPLRFIIELIEAPDHDHPFILTPGILTGASAST